MTFYVHSQVHLKVNLFPVDIFQEKANEIGNFPEFTLWNYFYVCMIS